jgi:transposase InsO family protein
MGKRRNWEQIGELIGKIKAEGLSIKEGASHFGISPWVLYDYNRRQKEGGIKGSVEGGSMVDKPARGGIRLPVEVQNLILDHRREHPGHGFKRIQDDLKKKHLVVVTRKQIRAVLKEHGVLEVLDSSFDREEEPAKGTRRFEAGYAGELYQMDVTYVYITGIPVLYLVVIIDDYSRFCVAADLCRDQKGSTLIEVLHNAGIRHGTPRKLLTDQGRGFYTWSMERTAFQHYLDEMKIEHIVSDPHSPETCGKVERLIQTIKKELLHRVRFSGYEEASRGIDAFMRSYNFDRPHQGIGGEVPANRFYGVRGEVCRVESELLSKAIDLSKGYLVYKIHDHALSVVSSPEGLQVFLDGNLLRGDGDHGTDD